MFFYSVRHYFGHQAVRNGVRFPASSVRTFGRMQIPKLSPWMGMISRPFWYIAEPPDRNPTEELILGQTDKQTNRQTNRHPYLINIIRLGLRPSLDPLRGSITFGDPPSHIDLNTFTIC